MTVLYKSHSPTETHSIGKTLGENLLPNAIVAFYGDLGSGKTTFIRGLAEGAGISDLRNVGSPTFSLLNIYQSQKKTIYHFDLYRLPEKNEFFAAGFDEYFTAGGICCLEWAEKILDEIPSPAIYVRISTFAEEERWIEIFEKTP